MGNSVFIFQNLRLWLHCVSSLRSSTVRQIYGIRWLDIVGSPSLLILLQERKPVNLKGVPIGPDLEQQKDMQPLRLSQILWACLWNRSISVSIIIRTVLTLTTSRIDLLPLKAKNPCRSHLDQDQASQIWRKRMTDQIKSEPNAQNTSTKVKRPTW